MSRGKKIKGKISESFKKRDQKLVSQSCQGPSIRHWENSVHTVTWSDVNLSSVLHICSTVVHSQTISNLTHVISCDVNSMKTLNFGRLISLTAKFPSIENI